MEVSLWLYCRSRMEAAVTHLEGRRIYFQLLKGLGMAAGRLISHGRVKEQVEKPEIELLIRWRLGQN